MLNDRETAIVTGAGRGIGEAIALMLGERGVHVIATARTAEQIEAVAREIVRRGGSAEAIAADLSKEKDILTLFEIVRGRYGKLDILVNNAGLGIYGPTSEFRTADLDALIAVNLRGTFLCCREAMKLMLPRKSGYIINISSVVGVKGYPRQAAYTSTKHGVVGLTKSIAAEAHDDRIRVSVVLPGGTDTEMVRKARPDIPPEELMKPEDIAQAVEYLLSLPEQTAVDELRLRRRTSKPF